MRPGMGERGCVRVHVFLCGGEAPYRELNEIAVP